MLREAAKVVYRHYSDRGEEGLELVVDRNVHFGWKGFTFAERLLRSVAHDIDPDLHSMPFTVLMKRWSGDVLSRLQDEGSAPVLLQ